MPLRIRPNVNVCIALLDEAQVHKRKALALMKRPRLRIATCPLIVIRPRVPAINRLITGKPA